VPQGLPPEHLQRLLRRPNPCVVASVRADGDLHTTATWYEWTDRGSVLLNMAADRLRLRHLREDPRAALTVLALEDWRVHVSLIGRVAEIRRDASLEDIDRMALRYTGARHRIRDRERWTAEIEVTRWHSFALGVDLTKDPDSWEFADDSAAIGQSWS
jgi:PPOX class probable F420-dependent enzyme